MKYDVLYTVSILRPELLQDQMQSWDRKGKVEFLGELCFNLLILGFAVMLGISDILRVQFQGLRRR